MAKSDPKKDLERFGQALNASIERLNQPTQTRIYGDLAVQIIVRRTRLGFGVDTPGGTRFSLPKFSDSYQKLRSRVFRGQRHAVNATAKKKAGTLVRGSKSAKKLKVYNSKRRRGVGAAAMDIDAEFFREKKPNNTFSGQMLRSFQVLDAGQGYAIVGPTGSRRNGRATNDEIAGYLREKSRGFTSLSKEEEKQILNQFERDVKKSLGSLLTNR